MWSWYIKYSLGRLAVKRIDMICFRWLGDNMCRSVRVVARHIATGENTELNAICFRERNLEGSERGPD